MSKKKLTKEELEDLDRDKATLLTLIKEANYNVYTTTYHVSSNGMSRKISCFIAPKNGQIMCIDCYMVALDVAKWDRDRRHLTVGGCGMDMGFHLVYSLGRTLFPNGFIPIEHNNKWGRNGTPNTELDTDGGYSLNQMWL